MITIPGRVYCFAYRSGLVLAGLAILAGCATPNKTHQFKPAPMARVRAQELGPARPRLISELVKSAQEEFEAANASQEKGEKEAAVQHYTKMLDLLKEANLDPSAFYNLRGEFQRIVENTTPKEEAQATEQPAGEVGQYSVEEALKQANEAQEQGDREAALRHYTRMLELLAQNNLDPETFFSLRSEFGRILDRSERQAAIADRERVNLWRSRELNLREPMKEIEVEFPLSDRVLQEIEGIQNGYPKSFQAGLDRSAKYVPYLRDELAKAGMPQDLIWLVMVESQFSPKVVSRAGAAGMWQFMKETGNRYGLKVDRYVDDRFNWQKSTGAAIQYLSELYERFDGSWPLAVSAYNMGENGVDRAVASAGGDRNLWHLIDANLLPDETEKYYPRFLASVVVAKDPERFGFTMPAPEPENTVRVPVHGSYALSALDKAAGLPEGTLRQLNPDLIRGVTPPSGDYDVAVPAPAGQQLTTAMNDLPQVRPEILRAFDRKRTHTVQRGETLEGIAKKYGLSTDAIKKANRFRLASRITPGRRLVIPGGQASIDELLSEESSSEESKDDAKDKEQDSDKRSEAKTNIKNAKYYIVKPGDTLEGIAKKTKTSISKLMFWNKKKIKNPHELQAGDQLVTTPWDEVTGDEEDELTTLTVKSGDSPSKIAKRYNVSVDDLMAWNNLAKTAKLSPGDHLIIRGIQKKAEEAPEEDQEPPGTQKLQARDKEPAAPKTTTVTHVAAKGDTASSIAQKYGVKTSDFLSWNKLTTKSYIQVGKKYSVNTAAPADKETPEPKVEKAPAKEEAPEPKVEKAPPKDTLYTAEKGDTPEEIALKYHIKTSDFLAWNNLTTKSYIQIGTKYRVAALTEDKEAKAAPKDPKPVEKETTVEAKKEPSEPKSEKAASTETQYTAAKGDTPEKIALRYHIKTSDFLALNNLTPKSYIQIGTKYRVAALAGSGDPKPAEKATTVETKETKSTEKNAKAETKDTKSTDKKDKAPDKEKPKAQAPATTTHTVAKGDSPSTIAARYHVKLSDLYKWNNWGKNPVLQIGQKVAILQ